MFDLDNTLTESYCPVEPEMVDKLERLMKKVPLAIVSGASFRRMEENLLPSFPEEKHQGQLYLFPDTAAQCYLWKTSGWEREYNQVLGKDDYDRVVSVVNDALQTFRVADEPANGERVLARETQITLSLIGTDASPTEKAVWDPDRAKRRALKAFLDERLPGFDVRISGRTAIDITRKGVDKSYAVTWFAKNLGIRPHEMLFVGDDMGPGGNDAMVIPTGIQTRSVAGPRETAEVIDELILGCGA